MLFRQRQTLLRTVRWQLTRATLLQSATAAELSLGIALSELHSFIRAEKRCLQTSETVESFERER